MAQRSGCRVGNRQAIIVVAVAAPAAAAVEVAFSHISLLYLSTTKDLHVSTSTRYWSEHPLTLPFAGLVHHGRIVVVVI